MVSIKRILTYDYVEFMDTDIHLHLLKHKKAMIEPKHQKLCLE